MQKLGNSSSPVLIFKQEVHVCTLGFLICKPQGQSVEASESGSYEAGTDGIIGC